MMIKKWYSDENLTVIFTKLPDVDILYPTPEMTDKEKDEIAKKPFINNKTIDVMLFDHVKNKRYMFTIDKGYRWDGATIPRFAWRIIGSKTDSKFLIPSMIHDVLCENKNLVNYDRYFADKVFERLLSVSNVSSWRRWLMFHTMDNYQKFQGWNDKEDNE